MVARQSPCERFECLLRGRCERQRLACHAFIYFVETSRAVDPRFVIEHKPGPRVVPKVLFKPQPMRELFDRLADDGLEPVKAAATPLAAPEAV